MQNGMVQRYVRAKNSTKKKLLQHVAQLKSVVDSLVF
jgi:hypothetical protein